MPRAVADFDTALENIGVRLQETGGQQYGARRLETLRRYLAKRGVTLEVGSSELAAGAAGEFRASANGIARLLLKANPTKELVWHELSHFVQWKNIGPDAYRALPRVFGNNVPEQFVFNTLDTPGRWGRLSLGYREHMVKYITENWGGIGR
jgi:hypothetical protein